MTMHFQLKFFSHYSKKQLRKSTEVVRIPKQLIRVVIHLVREQTVKNNHKFELQHLRQFYF